MYDVTYICNIINKLSLKIYYLFFENVAQSANFLPRQGQINVALKMFYGISPSGTTPLNPTEIGLIGIVDFPTAQRFGLPTAKLVNAAGAAVAPAPAGERGEARPMGGLCGGGRVRRRRGGGGRGGQRHDQ